MFKHSTIIAAVGLISAILTIAVTIDTYFLQTPIILAFLEPVTVTFTLPFGSVVLIFLLILLIVPVIYFISIAIAYKATHPQEIKSTDPSKDSAVARYYNELYHFKNYFAASIRLIGAADEFFPIESIRIVVKNDAYELPDGLLRERDEIIKRLRRSAEQKGQLFFDGPHTRLVDYCVSIVDHTEQKHLELVLGPLGWYDYSIGRWGVDQVKNFVDLGQYIELDKIAREGNIKASKLSNILCTATTVISRDGYALFSNRSRRVSSDDGMYTSCIAENIHQEMDESLRQPTKGELPAPFKTVIRGIEEELSPPIAKYVKDNPQSLFLLGLDFNLVTFHPNLLFLVVLPFDLCDIQNYYRESPGKDFIEGQVESISILNAKDNQDLDIVMSFPKWLPSGKASLIRAIEFLQAVQNNNPDMWFRELVDMLVQGKIKGEVRRTRL